jgi:hypothetical protein
MSGRHARSCKSNYAWPPPSCACSVASWKYQNFPEVPERGDIQAKGSGVSIAPFIFQNEVDTMRGLNVVLTCSIAVFVAACGNQNRDQISAKRNESGERPNFGSATDIIETNANTGNEIIKQPNTADVGLGGPVMREAGNYQRNSRAELESDRELAKQIKVAITTGSMGTTGVIAENQLTKIDVQVRDGVVTLSGPVANELEKRTIEKQVAGMKGIRGVQNNLTVGGRSVEHVPMDPLVPRTTGNQ